MAEQNEQTFLKELDPDRWVNEYGDYFYHFALGRLRNTTDAENAVQETFLAALRSKKSFAGRSTERTWLIGILKHKIIDHIRGSYREKPVTQLQNDEEGADQFFDRQEHFKKQPSQWRLDPKELLERKEFWDVFYQCSEKLPKAAGDAFLLREIEKVSGREVCKILGITQSNLWVLLHRARLQLRECLEKNWFVV